MRRPVEYSLTAADLQRVADQQLAAVVRITYTLSPDDYQAALAFDTNRWNADGLRAAWRGRPAFRLPRFGNSGADRFAQVCQVLRPVAGKLRQHDPVGA